jgi:dTDP-4-amino-4,6-dideoxygalactose transaminase
MHDQVFIPFSVPDVGEEEIQMVTEALRSGWITSGPRTAQFESEFKQYTGAAQALAVNSCTAGLHLALTAFGLRPGDEVITTPLTFCATVNTILEAGAKPVLADIGADLNISVEHIRKAITPRTKAIVPVHYGGLPCEMDEIWSIARQHNLKVLEDAAHAAGSVYRGVPIGSGSSDAVAFSFYATKNLCTGEGGMVTTPSEELYNRMKVLCLHGISRDAWNRYSEKGNWYYEVVDLGFKYNMSDILSAVGIPQLRRLDAMNARRAAIAARFNVAFAQIGELELPPTRPDVTHCWHLYALRLNLDRLDIDRAQFIDEMKSRGIGCSVHFIPIPLHPYYRSHLEMRDPCLRAVEQYPRLVSLPIHSKMTDEDVERVIAAVRDIVRQHCRRTVVAGVTRG